MKMTPTRRNTLRILKGAIDRAFAKTVVSIGKRRAIDIPALWDEASTPSAEQTIDSLFATVAFSKARKFADLPSQNLRSLLGVVVRYAYTGGGNQNRFEDHLLADLRANAAQYELMAQMPQPRKERKKSAPKTLVERRAEKADAKVAEWERKLKYAKTKLAAYRKKQKYYAKKGAAV